MAGVSNNYMAKAIVPVSELCLEPCVWFARRLRGDGWKSVSEKMYESQAYDTRIDLNDGVTVRDLDDNLLASAEGIKGLEEVANNAARIEAMLDLLDIWTAEDKRGDEPF